MPDPKPKWISQMLVNDLTLCCFDGINDAGVCMVLLVVHYEDGDSVNIPTGTNPSAAKTIHGSNMARYVLDFANSAAHGVELTKSVNTYGTLEHCTFHWMVCDEKENYFVEIMGNELKATKVDNNPIEKFSKPIITNFYMQKDTAMQKVPGGIERYDLLVKDYDKTTTVECMFSALKNIRFSHKYEGKDPAEQAKAGLPDNNWYSEFYSHVFQPKTFAPLYFHRKSSRQDMWDLMIKDDIEENAIWKFDNSRLHPMTSWTCHSSVYDIKNRTMQVVTGEQYNKVLPSNTTSFKLGK